MSSTSTSDQRENDNGHHGFDGVFVRHQLKSDSTFKWLLGIELEGRLVTFKVGESMPARHVEPRLVERVDDASMETAGYEGPDPSGATEFDSMSISDRGVHEIVENENDHLRVRLHGATTRGEFVIDRVGGQRYEIRSVGDATPPWQPVDGPGVHACAVDQPPGDDVNWSLEPFFAGRRVWYVVAGGHSRVRDAAGDDLSEVVPEVMGLGETVGAAQLVLDGVLTIFDPQRRPDPTALRARLDEGVADAPVVFVAFDLLQLNGLPLREYPFWHRRSQLESLGIQDRHWVTSPHWDDTRLAAVIEAVADRGMDRIVAKRRGAPYGPGGPTDAWRIIRV